MIDKTLLEQYAGDNIEQILNSLGLDYICESDYVSIRCPFHNGDDYNLKFRNGFWYCFSQCQKTYSTIDVVMQVLNLSFKEALNWLCKELNIESDSVTIDQEKIAIRRKLKRLKRMKKCNHKVEYVPISQSIMNDIEQYNHPYLLDQGFKAKTLEHFNIGFARGGEMINRVVFPIDAPNGDIVSLSGRLPNAEQLGLPKYKILGNSYKSKTLYNISRINGEGYVIVVEGFKSVLSLYEWGFNNVVATMGASLSTEQRNILLGLGKDIIVIGDNDESGKRLCQSVYNQCYRFAKVVQIEMSEFTNVKKASPCESDIGFDSMLELTDKIKELIK